MFWTKKVSKTAKYTIIKNYGQLKGGLNTPLLVTLLIDCTITVLL